MVFEKYEVTVYSSLITKKIYTLMAIQDYLIHISGAPASKAHDLFSRKKRFKVRLIVRKIRYTAPQHSGLPPRNKLHEVDTRILLTKLAYNCKYKANTIRSYCRSNTQLHYVVTTAVSYDKSKNQN